MINKFLIIVLTSILFMIGLKMFWFGIKIDPKHLRFEDFMYGSLFLLGSICCFYIGVIQT